MACEKNYSTSLVIKLMRIENTMRCGIYFLE